MDISIDAPPRAREHFSFTNFFLMHKGDLTLAFSAFVYLVSLAALMFTHWKTSSEIAVSMAEAALIGGLCDYIALKMIFERRWYLPNSGVLPRNRAKLIDGIAATIENEWLTPQMIGRKLSDMNLVGRLGAQSIGARVAANLRKRLPELQNDPELRDTIESAIHEFGLQLHDPDSYANQFAQRLIDNMVRRTVDASRGQITMMVRENLARLSDDQIRIQIESKTRTHLDWIRVNGGLFGAFFGLLFALSRILSHNGPAILAHFHIAM
jgi:uncharacterized membrane-anchored protein YjiN (DUF445 family)